MITTAMTRLVGCSLPIQQAPMGPVSPPELALAVAGAGGVGTITSLGDSADRMQSRLEGFRSAGDGALAVNFLTADIDPAAVEVAAHHVRVIDFFWRDPDASLVAIAHRGGALVNWQVGSLAEARAAADAGCDMVTVQGIEAGGHIRGETALLPLLGAVLAEMQVPVLAAGGIADARALAAVLAAGAAGARIGTRFIASSESGAHPDYIAAVLDAGLAATEICDAFANCPLCATSARARALRSAIEGANASDDETVGTETVGGEERPVPRHSGMPPHRTVRGQVGAMAMYAGQSVAVVTDVKPAGELARSITEGAERLLRVW